MATGGRLLPWGATETSKWPWIIVSQHPSETGASLTASLPFVPWKTHDLALLNLGWKMELNNFPWDSVFPLQWSEAQVTICVTVRTFPEQPLGGLCDYFPLEHMQLCLQCWSNIVSPLTKQGPLTLLNFHLPYQRSNVKVPHSFFLSFILSSLLTSSLTDLCSQGNQMHQFAGDSIICW